jgi:NAD(P)-dependent dehydrogenase (short-subunit alcohol dehydrogenase family)
MTDRVAIVTGGGSGIGRASALALARNGYSVVIAGRHREPLDETAKMAGEARVEPFVADVSQADQVQALFAHTKQTFGRLDVLFNNAGRGAPGVNLEELTHRRRSRS